MKKTTIYLLTLVLGLLSFNALAQNTVGLTSYVPSQSYLGYNLIYPHNQPNVYLLNNCGEIVHTWEDEPSFRPGNTAYLMENGNLVKTKRGAAIGGDRIWAGGGGAIVEMRSWDNDLLWSFEMNNDTQRLHHDIEVMPNGHILMIAWELKTREEAIAAGRDSNLLADQELWSDFIIEVDPENDAIVWEWHAWDHLIQDFDATKENFGVVADHPNKININWQTNESGADWLHSNAIDFNPFFDQIMLSVPTFHEFWIIDGSTSTAVATGSNGGHGGVGGDIWYRWGNPATYNRGDSTDQKLFYQHDPHWILEVDAANPYFNKVGVFNNRVGADYSTANVLSPLYEMYEGEFPMDGLTWGPDTFDLTVLHPDTFKMYSTGLSSFLILPNGNQLICVGRIGYSFELTPAGQIVWEYTVPLKAGQPVAQNTLLTTNDNLNFRIYRYATDYADFESLGLNQELTYLELEPNTNFCNDIISDVHDHMKYDLKIYPNPVDQQLTLEWEAGQVATIEVVDLWGRVHHHMEGMGGRMYLNVSDWNEGLYIVTIDGRVGRKVYIKHDR